MENNNKTLRAIERELPQLEDELCTLAGRALKVAMRYGELLHQAKSQLKHGQWLPWLKKHVRLSRSAAWHYMQLWERRDDPELAKCFAAKHLPSITDAYRALGLPAVHKDDEADQKSGCARVIKRLTKWEAMTLDMLKLNVESAIEEFVTIISHPGATPEQRMMWEALVVIVKERLRQLK
jgi:hypothetical protein